ncbi:hypothetical protein [Xenorhabdus bovienii]|uniref:hypothetical protein n=1 Tax=Xenorhabdus bovienii TaxID=40576 RepID=UPI0023B2DA08|nr:hypothetical protein [Xenorhabdus bovienii]MDE9545338.1 hypothetical protein [Xenorhabdus bovienii]
MFSAIAKNRGGIKFICTDDGTDELFNFLMSLMVIDSEVIKKFIKVAWDYIEGKEVIFPVQLIN